MKTIILGAGRRGTRLARRLIEEKNEVTLLDISSESVIRAMSSLDCLAIEGNGTNFDDLKKAGIETADALIAITGSDRSNLIACSIASSEFKVPLTIASIRNLDIPESRNSKNTIMGINHIINPVQEAAYHIYKNIERGVYSDIITFENSSLVLYNIDIDKNSKLAGKKVKDIRTLIPGQFVIAAIARENHAMVPNGDTVVQTGDIISVCADEQTIGHILASVGQKKQKSKKIGIVGGTNVADYLISKFDVKKQNNITLIEKDKDVCEKFASKYPDILVINDSITREGFFKAEGLETYDLLISLTENDELNIITSSYAKHVGVKNVVALVNDNADYVRMADYLDIDSVISSQILTVDSVMKYLHGSNVSSVHSMFDGDIEAIEYKVESEHEICNKALKDIDMKGKGIITGVIKTNSKKSETIIPNGYYQIEESDILLLVVERKYSSQVQDIFHVNRG